MLCESQRAAVSSVGKSITSGFNYNKRKKERKMLCVESLPVVVYLADILVSAHMPAAVCFHCSVGAMQTGDKPGYRAPWSTPRCALGVNRCGTSWISICSGGAAADTWPRRVALSVLFAEPWRFSLNSSVPSSPDAGTLIKKRISFINELKSII